VGAKGVRRGKLTDQIGTPVVHTYAITGASGTLGSALTHRLLSEGHHVRGLARNEHRMTALLESLPLVYRERFSPLCGDVRSRLRLARAFSRCDYVIHAAAMKHVGRCEYDPDEAVQTNIVGTQNVVDACLDVGVKRAVFISSDKACAPYNLYGMTKATGERLWLAGNRYSAGVGTEFTAVRYGNVWASNGSVVMKWLAERGGVIQVTDPEATRFHFRIQDALTFVLEVLHTGMSGSLYVPRLPWYRLKDLMACFMYRKVEHIGLQPGEKKHELMLSEHESKNAVKDGENRIRIDPAIKGEATEEYKSGGNWPSKWQMTYEQLKEEVKCLKTKYSS
jgi:UDP-N-acetylglucosamine 4,6-dehydratase